MLMRSGYPPLIVAGRIDIHHCLMMVGAAIGLFAIVGFYHRETAERHFPARCGRFLLLQNMWICGCATASLDSAENLAVDLLREKYLRRIYKLVTNYMLSRQRESRKDYI